MRPDGSPGLLVVPAGFEPARSLGWSVSDWLQTFLCHGPGDLQGDPLKLDEEVTAFVAMAYGLGPGGRRLVNRAVLSRLKGRAKSELGGALVCAELLAPVRFDHWAAKGETSAWGYRYRVGEPVGRPVRSPFIRCLSTEENQSGNTYDNVTVMLEYAQEHWPDLFPVDLGRSAETSTRIYLAGGGEVRPSTASSAAKDGGKESFSVADEPHLYVTRELRRMHTTVSRNGTKRKLAEPWMLETSTMYEPGEESVAEVAHRFALAIAAGKAANPGLLYDHRQGLDPDNFDWDDDEALAAAVRAAQGPAVAWMDTDRVVAEIRDPKTQRSDAVRYFLNRPHKGERRAVDPDLWRRRAKAIEVPDGARVALGFDGSISRDATALVGCTEDGHLFEVAVWERPFRAPADWRVPRAEVRAAVRQAFVRWAVGRMFCDPPKWETEIGDWAEEFGDEVVLILDTNQWSKMAPACSRLDTALVEGTATHDGGEALTRHALAAERKKVRISDDDDDGRTKFVWVKSQTGEKIDALVAATLAHEAAITMPVAPAPVEPWFAFG